MSKDLWSVVVIVLVIVIGGLAYLLLPGRLNGPTSNGELGTSTATGTVVTTIIATTTNSKPQSLPAGDNGFEQTGS